MSSSDRGRRMGAPLSGRPASSRFCGAVALPPARCSRSMGRRRRGGRSPTTLTQIIIDPTDDRVGQVVRNKLIFDLTGGAAMTNPLYRMHLNVSSSETALGVTNDRAAPTYSVTVAVTYEVTQGRRPARSSSRAPAAARPPTTASTRSSPMSAPRSTRRTAPPPAPPTTFRIRVAAAARERAPARPRRPRKPTWFRSSPPIATASSPSPIRRSASSLIYGGDDGLVAERVATFVKAVTGASGRSLLPCPPGAERDRRRSRPPRRRGPRRAALRRPARDLDPPLRATARSSRRSKAILAAPPVDSWVVIAAGELRKTSPLRKLCETHKGAAAIACYADTGRDLDRIIDEETKAAGLRIAADARVALQDLIGADRLASRSGGRASSASMRPAEARSRSTTSAPSSATLRPSPSTRPSTRSRSGTPTPSTAPIAG